MRVALTGATGFLGRRTLAALREQGQAVRGLSRQKESTAGLEGLVEEWCLVILVPMLRPLINFEL